MRGSFAFKDRTALCLNCCLVLVPKERLESAAAAEAEALNRTRNQLLLSPRASVDADGAALLRENILKSADNNILNRSTDNILFRSTDNILNRSNNNNNESILPLNRSNDNVLSSSLDDSNMNLLYKISSI